ncbi:gluconokinase [Thermopolyspora flexuosa]|jgi:gluconokinase|uniref:Gluconokinase n=1 Tax=Thermopolyspora flexuosa TaxID=103836 RepID=A0A543IWV4_9ACTN|nr:gluconokinase [Thermopolyspora flexuosa]TQM75037.1 gluconokinase [Thermopolyspora flexuosa]GGM92639.1 gluconokinase [Thermopolyspora flexuosa]
MATHVIVMGVAGSGKSTVARLLADRLGLRFAEADRFHPPANIAKMERGVPLDDADRLPWLTDLAAWIRDREAEGASTVVACSALKRRYRDILRTGAPEVFFAHLAGTEEVIRDRLAARSGHFFPPALLSSQFRDLEPLQPDEHGITLDVAEPPERLADRLAALLAAKQ